MYNKFLRITYPLYLKIRYGTTLLRKYSQELNESQWWSTDELAALQLRRLQALLRHAYQNVPYYSRKFGEIGLEPEDIKTLDDLPRLPILTRQDVRENLPDLVARNFPRSRLIPSSTGGSTGEPMQFYADGETRWRGEAARERAYFWYGYEMGDKVAYLWGSQSDLSLQQSFYSRLFNLVLRTIFLDAFNMSENRMGKFAQKLARFKPQTIIAYASAANLFAWYLHDRGIDNVKTRVAITQAEKLFPEQRQLIEEVLNCEVFDFYGSREVSTIAAECPQHGGYHISAENIVLEFIKDNEPVSPGETGKILVTDLHNYAMPFIRYENGDLGVPSGERCSCGRGLPLIHSIEGRATDVLVIGNKFISSPSLTLLFKNLPVKQYQLVQEAENEIIIKIVKTAEFIDKDAEQLLKMIRTYVGSDVELNLQSVSVIPPAVSGKHRFIISKVPLKIPSYVSKYRTAKESRFVGESNLLNDFPRLAVEQGLFKSVGRLQFWLKMFYSGISLDRKSLLDIGCGPGLLSIYAYLNGARPVVGLEPEAEGSVAGIRDNFNEMIQRLDLKEIAVLPFRFQDYDPGSQKFDIIVLCSSINHLDEEACIHLQHSQSARDRYRLLFQKMHSLLAPGGKIIISDCSRYNFFGSLFGRNPFGWDIEWHKHQPPRFWAKLMEGCGFTNPRINWETPLKLRKFGKPLGNPVALYFILNYFRLVMDKK